MLDYNVYEDVAKRSGGDIYIGVVGPVRTGKSTFIKKFMTELVIPNVTDENARAVMIDELPQSASGRTVMTCEPKFVPARAAQINVESAVANVRLVDCVGFPAEGAAGFEEDGSPRLVNTPWHSSPVPLSEAAAVGTDKVIKEHSTIGVLVTTDGSFTDIPRAGYAGAEELTVKKLNALGKPYVIVLNCADPESDGAKQLKAELESKYGGTVTALNCERATAEELLGVLKAVLFEFPVLSFDVNIPDWMRYLPRGCTAISELLERIKSVAPQISKMRDCRLFDELTKDCSCWNAGAAMRLDLSCGSAAVDVSPREGVFFEMLSEISGDPISDECSLMRYVSGAAEAKRNYAKIKDALECARVSGYGIVQPDESDMSFERPEVVRRSGNVGIKLRATAPSYHIIKIDVAGEVSPILGSAAQSESLVAGMMQGFETDPETAWNADVFGKSLKGMVKDGLSGKVNCMHDVTKVKMRRAVTRIVNEGKGGVICILL